MTSSFSMSATLRADLIARIHRCSRPLAPQPTGIVSQWNIRSPIRAVLFDVYGTLLISMAGELGADPESCNIPYIMAAMQAAGIPCDEAMARLAAEWLHQNIQEAHAAANARGIEYPEADICRIWGDALNRLAARGALCREVNEAVVLIMALEYELRANPVWPMPGLRETIRTLHSAGLPLGIVSNAQFYTPLILDAFEDTGWSAGCFNSRLCAWSWEQGIAKPSPRLFDAVLRELSETWGIRPEDVLYVGNDMLNDVWAAGQIGCRTVLFAGDARSFRPRADDPRVAGLLPDAVITRFDQLLQLVSG